MPGKVASRYGTEVTIRLYEGSPPAPSSPASLHAWVIEQVVSTRFVVTAYSFTNVRSDFGEYEEQQSRIDMEQTK